MDMDTDAAHMRREEDITLSPDELHLAQLGYKQEFKRHFSRLELFGVSFSIIGVVPSIASVLVYAIPNGGTSAMVWGWAVCAIMAIFISLAMGELASAMPTSGGLYYWTFMYSPPRWRCLTSWMVGYANTIGLIAGLASVDWGLAIQIGAAASIGSNLKFIPSTAEIYGIYAAVIASHALICGLATRVMARLQNIYTALNIVLCLGVIIALPAATPKEFRNTASFSLGNFLNFNGWPDGYAFVLSFLAPVWTIGAYDSAVHISEEAANARTAVPFSIIMSVVVAGIIGFGINLALAFNMGTDLENILSNSIGQPLATIFFNSFGKRGTLALWSLIIIVQFMMGSSLLLASSRQTFAFSRDGALPFSRIVSRVNPYTQTPVNGVWLAATTALALGLLGFAGTDAITAVFALSVAGQNVAYSIPIASRVLSRKQFEHGPFYLGNASVPVAVIAVAWMSFIIIVVMFPAIPGPKPDSMNYTVVVLGGTLLLALAYYYFPVYGGVHWFQGPIRNISAEVEKKVEEKQAAVGRMNEQRSNISEETKMKSDGHVEFAIMEA